MAGLNLGLVNVTERDERVYYCIVGDDHGYNYQMFQLNVIPRSDTQGGKCFLSVFVERPCTNRFCCDFNYSYGVRSYATKSYIHPCLTFSSCIKVNFSIEKMPVL